MASFSTTLSAGINNGQPDRLRRAPHVSGPVPEGKHHEVGNLYESEQQNPHC
jgi:hypothetical protein